MSLIREVENVKEWLQLKGSGVPFIVGHGIRSWTSGAFKRYPQNVVMNICAAYGEDEGSNVVFAVEKEQYLNSAQKLFHNLAMLEAFYQEFEHDEAMFHAAIKKLEKKKEFLAHYPSFVKAYEDVYTSGITIDGFLAYGDVVVSEMKQKCAAYQQEIDTLTQPHGLHFMQKEHLGLLTIALGLQSKMKDTEALIAEHHAAFHWTQNNYKNAQGLPITYFKERLAECISKPREKILKEKNDLETHEERHLRECRSIHQRGIFEEMDYQKLLWLGKIALWVDRRKACNLIANYYIDRYAHTMAEMQGLDYSSILFLFPWELDEILASRKSINDFPIEQRKKRMALVYTKQDEGGILIGEEAQTIKRLIDPEASEQVKELRGTSACRGKVIGRVRVIFDPYKQQINEGEILVTGMTRPDFLGLMQKAEAFITDEGGVTCHAAIVAREMNKACIIGTKIATKVLHDGDEVEVNANHGKITIIKRGARS